MRCGNALTLPAASCTMNCSGRLAQLVRAPALQAGGRRFEPCTAHHSRASFNAGRDIRDTPALLSRRLWPTHRGGSCNSSDRNIGDVVQLVRTLPCHGRGREFESRRPRHSFQKSRTNFAATNEGAKGHVFAPFLHPFSSIRAVLTTS